MQYLINNLVFIVDYCFYLQIIMKRSWLFIFGLLFLVFSSSLLTQCRKDGILTDPSAKLDFSNDTIIFDTVFTTVGSTTKRLKFYNNNKAKVNISSIHLAGGSTSPFRLNVDGVSGIEHNDIEIDAGDSLFAFVEVTLDPNNGTLPLIIEDSLIFTTNGNEQKVKLVVWGQDAYFHANELVEGTWPNDKPHVVYGLCAVGFPGLDSSKTLNIQAGTQIHLHNNSQFYIYKSTLNVNGLEGNEVVFQGDRLEPYYQDVAGQWAGIYFNQSENSLIDHAIIKNGTYGVWADTFGISPLSVSVAHTEIYDMSFGAIISRGSKLDVSNTLARDCGSYCSALFYGGEYNFTNCTFANYWTEGDRSTPSFVLNNWYEYNNSNIVRDFTGNFTNCIFDGNKSHEFAIDTVDGGLNNISFNFCIIKSDETATPSGSFYNNIYKNQSPGYNDLTNGDFSLYSTSYAVDKGTSVGLTDDIDGNTRPSGVTFDVGAYENQ